MTKLAQILLQTFAWGLIVLGMAAGVFLGRLSQGPIDLAWLKPRIESALAPGLDDMQVTVGRTEMRLDERRRTIELVGLDVRYRAADGQPFLTFPEVDIALSVEAFLHHGLIAASRVEATAPALHLTRNAEGIIGLYSSETASEPGSEIDFAAFLRHLVLAPETDSRIAFLKRLHISGGEVVYHDLTKGDASEASASAPGPLVRPRTLSANAADLVLIRQEDGMSGWLKANILQDDGEARLQLLARVDAEAERLHFSAELQNLVVADLMRTWRDDLPWMPDELDRIRILVQAAISGALDFDGELAPFEVEMRVAEGVIDLPERLAQPLDLSFGEVKAVIAPDFDAVDIQSLRLVSGRTELTAAGRLAWGDGAPSLHLDLAAADLQARDLAAFWPPDFGARARDWVVENIRNGRVRRGEATLDLQPGDFGPEPLRDDALKGGFDFEGVSVRYIDTMPPVEEGAGRATFNADRLHFDVASARNAGVEVVGGAVTITGLGKPGRDATRLHAQADIRGPVEDALALLDHPPLDVAKDVEIPPAQTSGRFAGKLDIRLPLHDDLTDEEIDVIADASLEDVAIAGLPRLGDDIRLEGGAFELTIDDKAVRLKGPALVAGLPVVIDLLEPLTEGTAKRRILLEGKLTPAILDHLDLSVDGLDGALAFKATLTETEENIWIDLEADLTDLAVAIPDIAWGKAAGDKGRLLASIAAPNDGPIEIKQFEVTAKDIEAAGAFSLSGADYGLTSLALSRITIGESRGRLRFDRQGAAAPTIVIEADQLDLDDLIAETGDAADDDASTTPLDHLHLVMRAHSLRYRGVALRDVQADAYRREQRWRTASFLGALDAGGNIALELASDGESESQTLDIRSDDAGAFIKALDLGHRVDGGALQLTARLTSQDPVRAEGRLEIDEFSLEDAPLLARLLTVASLTGIGNLLEGEGLQVDELILPFSLEDRTLTLTHGLLRGSQLGLTTKGTVDFRHETLDLAGTIIPVYSLNRLIGQVPIIGRILTGAEGKGAFAATYQIKGAKVDPTIYVNPLSLLTPGLIRDFFGGLVNGALEPPELRDTDD